MHSTFARVFHIFLFLSHLFSQIYIWLFKKKSQRQTRCSVPYPEHLITNVAFTDVLSSIISKHINNLFYLFIFHLQKWIAICKWYIWNNIVLYATTKPSPFSFILVSQNGSICFYIVSTHSFISSNRIMLTLELHLFTILSSSPPPNPSLVPPLSCYSSNHVFIKLWSSILIPSHKVMDKTNSYVLVPSFISLCIYLTSQDWATFIQVYYIFSLSLSSTNT